ncbi:Gfo/Idh/MocA family oxidoreductase [Mucilaginibacter sp. RS28]|uniref:Gfo/Idh/MocA family oxidoreductase n=1 Tax=Mucilaginibacter straminoryzae TaxID=2932774 RepID=A0A9X2BCJ1_9SPHI|nr:Gfo/Idh/MocA family oxidoreductase [Mucilaginibacter straminoryzae]MCJ8209343.1 Gfo/Idh/MocA family oxidoreductase [Mucilaginibacter straminoryzae]
MKQIRWGIIGCGNVTEKKSGPAFSKVPDSKLAAVMRRNGEKAADYAKRHNVEQWFDDAEQMMDNAGLDAVYIATPPDSHLPYALRALEKGLNVYVEKPVTRNAAEAEELAQAVSKASSKLCVAHYRRAVPMFIHVKKLLAEQAIGEVRTVQIRMWKSADAEMIAKTATNWRVHPDQSGGGYFHDLAPHQLDLMMHWFGTPKAYSGYSLNQSKSYPADDHVTGTIIFENNVVVNGSWSFNVAKAQVVDLCEIVGTEGKISFPFFGNTVRLQNNQGDETITFEHPEHIQQPLIQKIVQYFNGEADNPSPIEEAVTLMKVLDAFTTSNM